MAPATDSWWRSVGTPRQNFILGGAWIVIAAAYGVAAIGEPAGWPLFLSVLTALLGVAYLVTAVTLRRRRRRSDG